MKFNKWTSSKKFHGALETNENKIQLLYCPRGGFNCKSHVAEINSLFVESQNYWQNKEYQYSFQALKSAFEETLELQEPTCINCADFFRSEIINSLTNIHNELHSMSRGIFRRKYRNSKELADKILIELTEKQEKIQYTNQNTQTQKYGT